MLSMPVSHLISQLCLKALPHSIVLAQPNFFLDTRVNKIRLCLCTDLLVPNLTASEMGRTRTEKIRVLSII